MTLPDIASAVGGSSLRLISLAAATMRQSFISPFLFIVFLEMI